MSSKTKKTRISKCAICKTRGDFELVYAKNFQNSHINTSIFSARRLPDRIHGTVIKCIRCGLVRSKQFVKSSTLEKLYQNSQFTYAKLTNNLSSTYFSILNPILKSKDCNILEIGCGNGFLLSYLKKKGYKNVWGIEPSSNAKKKASPKIRSRIKLGILDKNIKFDQKFDVICAFQVFDHIQNPRSFLKICHKLLKPQGKVLLMNHDVESWSAKILGERSPIFDIEHTYLYSQKTIRKILNINRFIVSRVYSPPSIMTIRYILRLLPIPRSFKVWITASGQKILNYNLKVYPGNLCAIAIKK